MAGELAVLQTQLTALRPRLESALAGIMPVTRLEQTILVSCERTPDVLKCTPQSVLNAAMTFAVLGLPVDGSTGQGFLLPFKDKNRKDGMKVAQAVIGYKGYNTLGARAGLTITAGTVREGDEFDFRKGSGAFVSHRERLNNRSRIIAFWSCAEARDRPPIVEVLSLEQILDIKAKSRADSGPWHDEGIGFPAMGEKSTRRRLARSLPLVFTAPQYQLAARMEEAVDEQGKAAWITNKGVIVEGEVVASSDVFPARNQATPDAGALIGPRTISKSFMDGSPEGQIMSHLKSEAEKGTAALQTAWLELSRRDQHTFKTMKEEHLKKIAAQADRRAQGESDATEHRPDS